MPPAWRGKTFWLAYTAWQAVAQRRLPFLPAERLRELQDRKVRAIVGHAYRTVPFYRQVMDERGLRPGDIRTAADLALLPVVTGSELATQPARFLSNAAAQPLLELTTSGSSGHSKRVLWSRAAVLQAWAAGRRQRAVATSFLGHGSRRRAVSVGRLGGTGDDVRAFHRQHAWLASRLDAEPVRVSPAESFERNLEIVNSVRPDIIQGFGSYIGALFRWAWRTGRSIARPLLIWYGGDSLCEPDRRLLEADYGIAVVSSYQACEALRIAYQCERARGFHVSVDQVALRIADAAGHSLPPGQQGRVVISNLTNRATVLLNYDLGDMGSLAAGLCSCGRTLPLLESLDGRADDFVLLPDGELAHESVLLSSLYAVPGVVRLQLIQEAVSRFRIRVVCSRASDGKLTLDGLARALPVVLGHQVSVEIEPVAEITADPSGKFKSIISRCRRE